MVFVLFSLPVVLFNSHNYLTSEVSHQFHSRMEFKKMKKLNAAETCKHQITATLTLSADIHRTATCRHMRLRTVNWPGFKGRSQLSTQQKPTSSSALSAWHKHYIQRNSNFICIQQQQQKSQLLSILEVLQQSGAHGAACHKWFQMYLIQTWWQIWCPGNHSQVMRYKKFLRRMNHCQKGSSPNRKTVIEK